MLCVACGREQLPLFPPYFRCSCGLVSQHPIPDAAEISRHYAARFRDGNYAVRQSAGEYDAVNAEYARLVCSLSPVPGRILDVGCFTGDFLAEMAKHGWSVSGVDLQSDAVEIANHRLGYGAVRCGTIFDVPPGQFDVITMLAVIEHLPNPTAAIRKAAELLTPGGWLVIETPDSGSLLARLLQRAWPPYVPTEHLNLFSRDALRRILLREGFCEPVFRAHWKTLSLGYVRRMLGVFGPRLQHWLPPFLDGLRLPLYCGEMIAVARKHV